MGQGRTLSEAEFEQVKQAVLASAPPNMDEATFNRWAGPQLAAALAEAELRPAGTTFDRFTAGIWEHVNPAGILSGLGEVAWDPAKAVVNVAKAQGAQFGKAVEDVRQGDYLTAAGHTVAGLTPLVGPAAAAAGERAAETGDIAGAVGEGLGLTASIVAPGMAVKAAKGIGSLPIVPRIGSRVPAEAAAVEWGVREGLPVDVGTATGNKFLRGTQALAEESLGGSTLVSPQARAAQQAAFTAKGEQLAGRVHPSAVTAEGAGEAVQTATKARAAGYSAEADVAYGKLRALEAQQQQLIQRTGGVQAPATSRMAFTKTPLAVDIVPTKAAMRPLYNALKREAELVPLMGDKARALTTLDRLMNAPDVAPLSVADSVLGDIKAMARVDDAFRRTAGQGVAAEAVTNLEQSVRATAMQAGPDAFRALMDGRAATVNKFKTIEVLDALRADPEAVFKQLTRGDAGSITRLREVAKVAPQALPQIGRAWLEDLLGQATKERGGGFHFTESLYNRWAKLGPDTKALLFKNPQHIQDLDNFFLLSKKLGERVNPSGTAMLTAKGAEALSLAKQVMDPGVGLLYTIGAPVVAKLLLSPTTTRFLLQGLRLPVGATAARTLWGQRLAALLAQPESGLVSHGIPAPQTSKE
ncbi:MAG TPA: hypothetical protein VKD25_08785 [Burkholderiales bacterium]|nr:hypothetical protein [Burkholderiales bacterium]